MKVSRIFIPLVFCLIAFCANCQTMKFSYLKKGNDYFTIWSNDSIQFQEITLDTKIFKSKIFYMYHSGEDMFIVGTYPNYKQNSIVGCLKLTYEEFLDFYVDLNSEEIESISLVHNIADNYFKHESKYASGKERIIEYFFNEELKKYEYYDIGNLNFKNKYSIWIPWKIVINGGSDIILDEIIEEEKDLESLWYYYEAISNSDTSNSLRYLIKNNKGMFKMN